MISKTVNKYLYKIIELRFNSHTNKYICNKLKITEYTLKECNKVIDTMYFSYINLGSGECVKVKEIIPYDVQLYTYIRSKEEVVKSKRFFSISPFRTSMLTLRRHSNNILISTNYFDLCEDYYIQYLASNDVGMNEEGFLTSKGLYYIELSELSDYSKEKIMYYLDLYTKLNDNFYKMKEHIIKEINNSDTDTYKYTHIFLLKVIENFMWARHEYDLTVLQTLSKIYKVKLYIVTSDIKNLTNEQIEILKNQKLNESIYINLKIESDD